VQTRARGNFLLSGLVASGVQLDITAATSPKPKVLQTSQFNFMAYTVPPSAARLPRAAIFLFLLYPRPCARAIHPLKTFLLGILETFKSLPRFPRAF